MALNDLTAAAVRQAIVEFDRLGRDAFLAKYKIDKARGFWVLDNDTAYDSKALAGAAHGYLPGQEALTGSEFAGGENTVRRVMTSLGFRVETPLRPEALPNLGLSIGDYDGQSPPIRPVGATLPLSRGDDYRRDNAASTGRQEWFYRELAKIHRLTGRIELPVAFRATNGAYRLDKGNIGHAIAAGMLEALAPDKLVKAIRLTPAFVRSYGRETNGVKQPRDQPQPVPSANSHSPSNVVQTAQAQQLADLPDVDPNLSPDERRRFESERVIREGARAFRQAQLGIWRGRCAITRVSVSHVLEGAHIFPYLGEYTNHPTNGLLLRADIHRLFDAHLLSISIEGREIIVHVSPKLIRTAYGGLDGKRIALPAGHSLACRYVEHHYQEFEKKQEASSSKRTAPTANQSVIETLQRNSSPNIGC